MYLSSLRGSPEQCHQAFGKRGAPVKGVVRTARLAIDHVVGLRLDDVSKMPVASGVALIERQRVPRQAGRRHGDLFSGRRDRQKVLERPDLGRPFSGREGNAPAIRVDPKATRRETRASVQRWIELDGRASGHRDHPGCGLPAIHHGRAPHLH